MELTDLDHGQLAVGDSVRFAFRVKDIDRQRAFRRYFWKADEGIAMASGIRDKVAILGMGCSKFGERWDQRRGRSDARSVRRSADGCRHRARCHRRRLARRVLRRAEHRQVALADVDGAAAAEYSGHARRKSLRHRHRSTCAARSTPSRPVRATSRSPWAWRSSRTPVMSGCPSAPRARSKISICRAARRPARSRSSPAPTRRNTATAWTSCKQAMAHVSWKSHENGARNPKAHLRNRVTEEQILAAPTIAYPLGTYDCCGVSDGAACAIVTTPAIARELGKRDVVTVKALQLAPSNGVEMGHNSWDGSHTLTTPHRREARVCGGGHPRPAQGDRPDRGARLLLHHRARADGRSRPFRRRPAPHDIRDGRYDRDGAIPCQIDGGLKCFGHPIGATGLRMAYEIYLQLLGRAGERQLSQPFHRAHPQPRRHSQPQRCQRRACSACTSPEFSRRHSHEPTPC